MSVIALGFLISWYILENDYTRLALEILYEKSKWTVIDFILEHMTCFKCLSFWMTLALSQSLLFALIASFTAYIYDAYIKRD
jgi:hypothetical protein